MVEHGKSMLAYAVEAGKHLIAVKGMLQHGEFGKWVKANCVFPYTTARRYMQVAKMPNGGQFPEDLTVHELLYGERKADANARAKADASSTFDRADAEYILKLHAVAERGGTENEREVAGRKISNYARNAFGMSGEEAIAKAKDILPDWQKSSDQIEREKAREELAASQAEAAALRAQLEAIQARITGIKEEVASLSREELESLYIGLVLEREGLTKLPKERKKAA